MAAAAGAGAKATPAAAAAGACTIAAGARGARTTGARAAGVRIRIIILKYLRTYREKNSQFKNYADYLHLTLHSKQPTRGLGQTWVEPTLDGKQQLREYLANRSLLRIITYLGPQKRPTPKRSHV